MMVMIESETKQTATVPVLCRAPGELPSIAFLLNRAKVAMHPFDNEHELDNWLCHCADPAMPVTAAIVDAASFNRGHFRHACRDVLVRHRVPLLIVATEHERLDWQRIAGNADDDSTIFLTNAHQLPQFLDRLQKQRLKQSHGKGTINCE